jgi:hypothetical protein
MRFASADSMDSRSCFWRGERGVLSRAALKSLGQVAEVEPDASEVRA